MVTTYIEQQLAFKVVQFCTYLTLGKCSWGMLITEPSGQTSAVL